MSCRIIRKENTNEIISVMAANGQPSILYRDILNDYGDKEIALKKYLEIISAKSKEDVVKPEVEEFVTTSNPFDVNGEPIYTPRKTSLTSILKENQELLNRLDETNSINNTDLNCS
jgi:hypothetical protein